MLYQEEWWYVFSIGIEIPLSTMNYQLVEYKSSFYNQFRKKNMPFKRLGLYILRQICSSEEL